MFFFFFLSISLAFSLSFSFYVSLFFNSTLFTAYKLYITIFTQFWSVLWGSQAPARKTYLCT